ncbi:DUF3455 domain-containing protein [Roseateles oligotrophus]|uniref:DUF3455 domain-containing protein n=1 Tax=Roseateles oligotrophus TaxID=1769250 RepID=A0ABT2YIB7_9BURK|nr:DUF3455 domain-containing protein [Roseateles oligotrophus]MCV2369797.1 DUF3455 domain-containing protein [Roseateles oligotrophus]
MNKSFAVANIAKRSGLLVALLISFSAQAAPAAAIPEAIKAPAGQAMSLEVQATGVQIYECKANDAAKFEWVFKGPEAELFDGAGISIGKHYGGPSWESADGSKVVGEVKARDNGPDANAIPWLLLSAKSNSGAGVFGAVQSIQRVSTSGGKAPADGCNAAAAGKGVRVAYKAAYYFYTAKP